MNRFRWLMVPLAFVFMADFPQEALAQPPVGQEVQIEQVNVQFLPKGPVLLLQAGKTVIPIFVDPTVAGSIQGVLSGQTFPRPLPHELMHSILKNYRVKLTKVFITLRDGVYFGTLSFSYQGQTQVFDSRSSDAIALALHFGCPITIERRLLEEAGRGLAPLEESAEVDL